MVEYMHGMDSLLVFITLYEEVDCGNNVSAE